MAIVTPQKVRTKGQISLALEGLSVTERQLYKAQELAKIGAVNFTYEGIDVEIVSIEVYRGALQLHIRASIGGTELMVDNPVFILNPPIMVPDGTVHMEMTSAGEVEVPNLKEDPIMAMKQVIIDIVKGANPSLQ